MLSRLAELIKSTWVKLVFGAVFVLVNVTLYLQSKDFILHTIFPQTASNTSFPSDSTNVTNFYNMSALSQNIRISGSTGGSGQTNLNLVTTERSFLREQVVNPHDFNYVLKPNVSCSNEDVTLVICVPITSTNYVGRAVVRQTWGSYAYNTSNKARLVFFLGRIPPEYENSSAYTQGNITEESKQYGDILQEDFLDTYRNLSLKSVSILKWVVMFCNASRFVLKVDDDMYVNIPFLVKTLHEYSLEKSRPEAYVVGSLQVNAHPTKDSNSKWYSPNSPYFHKTYPNYVSGTAYAMTGITAAILYQASLRVPIFWLEDVYITGICTKKASVQVFNSNYFSYGKPSVSGCSFKAHVSGHRYTHKEILQIHKELYDPNKKC
ncbi:hypothetical protein BsWGS_25611 [Bradybaena similaris]